jgi:hypothetical protein
MRRALRGLAVAGALLMAACAPLRVDISEEAAGGFRAIARGDDAGSCGEARARVADEARYHCKARGMRPRLGSPVSTPDGAGCQVSLAFWCTVE